MAPSEQSAGPPPGGGDGQPEYGQALTTPTALHAHLAELHGLLTADRERTSDLISSLSRTFASIVEATHLTATDDEHDPEGPTIAFERSRTSALLTSANKRLADVDIALERIAHHRYGRCERCGESISLERLRARPAARTCIACAT